jgi:hypothetical protein
MRSLATLLEWMYGEYLYKCNRLGFTDIVGIGVARLTEQREISRAVSSRDEF